MSWIVGQERCSSVLSVEGGDAVELGLQRLQACRLDCVGVHAGGVVIADLLFIRSATGATGGCSFEHGMQDALGVLGDHGAGAVSRPITGDRIELGEIAAGVLGKIDQGSAVGSMRRVSRPGRRVGVLVDAAGA